MTIMTTLSACSLLLLTALMPHPLHAHSEHDKARFVASQGQDKGQCDQVLRPCKTIGYAINHANKGDRVLVAAGEYKVNNNEEIFYFASSLVPVYGGYNRFDHFQQQSPRSNVTSLVGVPPQMAALLREHGFNVISDGKSLAQSNSLTQKLKAFSALSQPQSLQTCENGKADSFNCENIDLLAHMPLGNFSSTPSAASDIWGHVDLNDGNEYALIGLTNGISVVNVSDPANPTEVGTIAGKSSTWRDVKVYQYFDHLLKIWRAYAYVILDGTQGHVTIVNLNHLPNSISLVALNDQVTKAHNVYISNLDHTLNIAQAGLTPSIQLIGSNKFGGAFHSYSLADPKTLTPLQNQFFGQGYTHDGASITITDDRKANNCQTDGPNCTVFVDFNEKDIKLWNITDVDKVVQLGSVTYSDVDTANKYVHSGWGSEDKQYFFAHDEFDEKRGGINTTVRVFSIADLTQPQQVGQWTGPTAAADHNGFVRGNRYYLSNYERGLSVLDISDPTAPVEVGNFDTFTPSDNANYSGAWGVYPFLPSGNLLVSDINSGLYVLKDNTRQSPQGNIAFNSDVLATEQGIELSIEIPRHGAAVSASTVSVSYELIPGSALANQDYTAVAGTLTWQDNDNQAKTIKVPIAEQVSAQELQESFFVRLYNPTQGATLSSPSYLRVNIAGIQNTGVISFVQDQVVVAENETNLVVTLSRDGSSQGQVAVNYSLQGNNAEIDQDVHNLAGTLIWQDGDRSNKTLTLELINDELAESDESFSLVLEPLDGSRLGEFSRLQVTISDDENNSAPQVELGENFEVSPGQSVQLTAQVTDDAANVLTYLWQQESGSAVTLNNSDQPAANFIAPNSSESLVFSLTVTDNMGAASSDTINISVIAPVTQQPSGQAAKSSGGSTGGSLIILMILTLCRLKLSVFQRPRSNETS